MSGNTGFLYIVGSGPGTADYITLKGYKAVKNADVIVYDYLVDESLLRLNQTAEKQCFTGSAAEKQVQLMEFVVEKYYEGKHIVRLKGGDPFIFGRLAEEIVFYKEKGLSFEIVPGITSAIGAAAELNLSLTQRDAASGVMFITAAEAEGKSNYIDWEKIAEFAQDYTVAVYMGHQRFSKIADLLMKRLPSESPVYIVASALTPHSKVILTNLRYAAQDLRTVHPPVIILFGGVVTRAVPRVLFTGTNYERFRHLGYIVLYPLLRFRKIATISSGEINRYDGIIFTSPRAVRYVLEDINPESLCTLEIFAIGRTTARVLAEAGLQSKRPANEHSTALIQLIKEKASSGARLLYPTSNLSNNGIVRALASAGFKIHRVVLYETLENTSLPPVDISRFDIVVFTSPSTVNFFKKRFGRPSGLSYRAIGPTTYAYLLEEGFDNVSIA